MKFNWGTKIALVYVGFVLFILFMVYMSFGEKYDLVTTDYYAKEIAFQDKIDKKSRLKTLPEQLSIRQAEGKIIIRFPHDETTKIQGEVYCFRPSDESKDFIEPIEAKRGEHRIPLNRFQKGKYLIKVDWQASGRTFYTEKTIIIP